MSNDSSVVVTDAERATGQIGASAFAEQDASYTARGPGSDYAQAGHGDDSVCSAIDDVALLCRQSDDPALEALDTFDDTAPPRAAFDAAVAYLRPDLLRYMRRRVRDVETAADLAQETLLRMLIYRDAPGIGSHALLMYRIAHNLVLEHWRARYRHHASAHIPLDLIETLQADTGSVEDIIDARNALDTLTRHTFPSLSAKCNQAFKLHRVDGLTYPEIAAIMGVSVKMVEKHISKALALCRAAVGSNSLTAQKPLK